MSNKKKSVDEQVEEVLSQSKKKGEGKKIEVSYTGTGNITINQYDVNEYQAKIDGLIKDRDDARDVIGEMKIAIDSLNKTIDILTKNIYTKDDLVITKDDLIETLKEEIKEKNEIIKEYHKKSTE